MTRQNPAQPRLKLSLWEKRGDLYFCDPDALRAIITEHNVPESEQRRRMGASFDHIERLLKGEGVNVWGLAMVELS